jgi:hypothetical protein
MRREANNHVAVANRAKLARGARNVISIGRRAYNNLPTLRRGDIGFTVNASRKNRHDGRNGQIGQRIRMGEIVARQVDSEPFPVGERDHVTIVLILQDVVMCIRETTLSAISRDKFCHKRVGYHAEGVGEVARLIVAPYRSFGQGRNFRGETGPRQASHGRLAVLKRVARVLNLGKVCPKEGERPAFGIAPIAHERAVSRAGFLRRCADRHGAGFRVR